MIDIATAIIKQQAGPFDPSQFNDHYEDALKALIEQNTAGRVPVGEAPPIEDTNVIDLMAALRASLTRGALRDQAGRATRREGGRGCAAGKGLGVNEGAAQGGLKSGPPLSSARVMAERPHQPPAHPCGSS